MRPSNPPTPGPGKEGRGALEEELKFSVEELGSWRLKLEDWGAREHAARAFEDNWILDREGSLSAEKRLLRLRRDGAGTLLTYKGPPSFRRGLKVREELETRVADVATLLAIFERLGYERSNRYQKYRQELVLDGTHIALDETPIGSFLELEGRGARELAQRLGLDPSKAEKRSYLELYEDHRHQNPSAPEQMVFESDS